MKIYEVKMGTAVPLSMVKRRLSTEIGDHYVIKAIRTTFKTIVQIM